MAATQQNDRKMVWLELTPQCNYRCVHCYVESGPEVTGTMEDDKWFALIDQASEQRFPVLQLTGGDPTMHPRFIDFVEHAASKSFDVVEVYTNGSTLKPKWIELFAETGVHVAISFYSDDRDTYEAITQKPGSFDKAVTNIQRLVAAGVPVRIGLIVMEQNQGHEARTIQFLTDLGVDAHKIGVDAVRPTGRGAAMAAAAGPPGMMKPDTSVVVPLEGISAKFGETGSDAAPAQAAPIAAMTKAKPDGAVAGAMATMPQADPFYWSVDELPTTFVVADNQDGAQMNSCWSGEFVVASSGDVFPCIFARDVSLGTVVDKDLGELIGTDPVQQTWELSLSDASDCAVCEFQFACFDCRALTHAVTGDMHAKPPGCHYLPRMGQMERKPRRADDETLLQMQVVAPQSLQLHRINDGVLLHNTDTAAMFVTNDTGGFVVASADQPVVVTRLIDSLAEATNVDTDTVRADLLPFVEDLLAHGALARHEG